jgi:tetratricopeptide (TPR) repeat protein
MNASITRGFHLNHWVVCVIITLSAFFLYGNSIGNKYCLDDAIVVTKNSFVEKGFSGIPDIFSTESFTGFFGKQKELVSGARYRPLSIATFAIERQIFDSYNPAFSHFVNVLLFAISGFIIYLLLKKLLVYKNPQLQWVPLITALLFVFHPVHTEVVANIKGRDEILALLFSLTACYLVLKYIDTNRMVLLVTGSAVWFLGLLSKENSIVFWVLMPMIIFIYGVKELKKYVVPLGLFSIAAIAFLVIRHKVIGSAIAGTDELMNNSFLQATPGQKYATIFYTFWKYLCLLVFPVKLTYDYYPYHIHLTELSDVGAILGVLSSAVIIVLLFISLRKHTIVSFSILFYILPLLLVSNMFFPIGTFMSERFLYFSSVGFCIIAALGFSWLMYKAKMNQKIALVLLAAIMVLASFKIIDRNRAWYNDYTLFTTDVKTSYNSAKSNCSAGGVLLESMDTINEPERKNAALNQSIRYLRRSIEIHPKYYDAWLLLGNAYFKKDLDSSIYCYTSILNNNPQHELAFKNLLAVENAEKSVDRKIDVLTKMWKYQPNSYDVNYELGKLFGKEKGDLDKSIYYLMRAIQINPREKFAFLDLGVALGLKRDYARSAEMLQKAIEIDPNDVNTIVNLGVTYQNMGQTSKANEYFKKAEVLKNQISNNK